jgi:hypothetical protein
MHELPRRHRITVEHFYRMAEAGLFAEDERVELIDGEIIGRGKASARRHHGPAGRSHIARRAGMRNRPGAARYDACRIASGLAPQTPTSEGERSDVDLLDVPCV